MDHCESRAVDVLAHEGCEGAGPTDDFTELVVRLRAGTDDAFDELVRRAGGRMFAVCRRMLGKDEDAWDAVQETFLSAFKSLDRFDGRSQITTWLHRIAVNVCLMRIRARRRRPEQSIEPLLPQFLSDGHQANPTNPWKLSPLDGIEQADVRALVRQKIAELPEQYRVVLLLRDIEELSTEETAQALGMTVNGVKTRLHRARQALRELLDPFYRTEGDLA